MRLIRFQPGRADLAVSCLLIGLTGSVLATPPEAAAITVEVHNVQAGKGQLLAGLCTQRQFLTGSCTVTAVQPVDSNPQRVMLAGAPAGLYAVQIVYDKNKNYRMDTGAYNAPSEPIGFSRDAVGRMGPPAFQDASFEYDGKARSLKIRVY